MQAISLFVYILFLPLLKVSLWTLVKELSPKMRWLLCLVPQEPTTVEQLFYWKKRRIREHFHWSTCLRGKDWPLLLAMMLLLWISTVTGMALVNSCCPCNKGWWSGLFLLWFLTLEIQGMSNPIFHILLEEVATSHRNSEDTVYISNYRRVLFRFKQLCKQRKKK